MTTSELLELVERRYGLVLNYKTLISWLQRHPADWVGCYTISPSGRLLWNQRGIDQLCRKAWSVVNLGEPIRQNSETRFN